MAYQFPQGGHYPPHQRYQQPYIPPTQQSPQQQHQYQPNSGAPYPQHINPASYPQVVLPGYPTYSPQPQPHYPSVSQPVNLPPSYPPQTGQVPPVQDGAALQYGGGPALQYYPGPNQPSIHSSPRPQIVIPPQPRSQPQPQPQPIAPAHAPRAYPQVQIQSRSVPHQQRSVSETSRPTPKVQQRPKREPSLQRMRSKSPVKRQEQHTHSGHAKKSIDYQVLLLALADEYLDAAHSRGTTLAVSRHETEIEDYYKLIATGLGCLEAVLKNWRLQPRTEALVRLRYARVLFEEADNDLEAETALSKGVDLCERNRLLDLKYSMQQLLARILYKSNPKAAMKSVDGMIRDIEVYRHATWEYAFRFLRVTMSLASTAHQDVVAASQNLHAISTSANRNGDKAVFIVSSILEALAHIQQSSSADSIEQAQRALAAARSHQLDDSVKGIPQINTMIQIVDTCCSLLEYDVNQAAQKLQSMQKAMDQNINDPKWQEDGTFSIPLSSHASAGSASGDGGIVGADNGRVVLTFSWLSEHDLYALCYFLSSVTLTAKNSQDGHKAEKYLQEGLRMIRSSFKSPQGIPESFVSATSRLQWRRTLYCNMLLQLIFLACARTDWQLASQALDDLRETIVELDDSTIETINCLLEYAAGVIAQGTGDLKSALAIFRKSVLALKPSASKTARNEPQRDTAILAALNTVLILSDPSRQSRPTAFKILSDMESFCRTSPNKYIQAAFFLVCATIQTESTIQTKRDLHNSLQAATAISNSQITCMALSFMSWKYFHNVVSEQSEKSAKAARAMARKADDKLWISVTDEILAGTLEQQGKVGEARAIRDSADASLAHLPAALKKPARPGAGGGGGFPPEVRMKAVQI